MNDIVDSPIVICEDIIAIHQRLHGDLLNKHLPAYVAAVKLRVKLQREAAKKKAAKK